MNKRLVLSLLSAAAVFIISLFILILVHTDFFGALNSGKKTQVKLYFLDSTLSRLSFEEKKIPEDDPDKLFTMINLLIKGPDNTVENKRAIPKDTKILSLGRKGNLVTVDFSSSFNSGQTADDMLAAFTVVYTLCGIDGIEQVSILVEGEPLVDTDKKPLGALSKSDIVNENEAGALNNTLALTLYFPNSDLTKLLRETRDVLVNDNISTAQLIINELMHDSQKGTSGFLFPKNTKLLSVETKNSTCFVNFSEDFIARRLGEEAPNEVLSVYAVVNSLTELEEIKKVQFLIEGQKVEDFGSIKLSQPFERNENIIAN